MWEKHKNNVHTQYGTFEDKAAQNIVRWLRKADKYQNAHMVPSLEMAAIVTHCIRGEPAIKVKRWLDVPGVTHINADHYNAQPVQIEAVGESRKTKALQRRTRSGFDIPLVFKAAMVSIICLFLEEPSRFPTFIV